MPGIYPLKGTVKYYDWGGHTLIPSLLNLENKDRKPYAEYWMGVHPRGESQIQNREGKWSLLSAYAQKLPWLFKILDVREMLSIQVHPTKMAAEKEFARENAEGIPLDSPQRNYKDDNHKPELMVALSDFWLLHGFKPPEDMVYTLLNVVELRELLPIFNQGGYAGLYTHVMKMEQEEVNRLLRPLLENVAAMYREGKQDGIDEDYWVSKASRQFAQSEHIDRGIFSIYLLNLVHLKKGQGIFQAAGIPHAYLEGQNVEIMANSDNVLRGGLTTKHVDVKELLKQVSFEANFPEIIEAEDDQAGEKIFPVPVTDFELALVELKENEIRNFAVATGEVLLCTEGVVEIISGNNRLSLEPGSPAAFVEAGQDVRVKAISRAQVFRASAPVNRG